jgi:hypothetical protein
MATTQVARESFPATEEEITDALKTDLRVLFDFYLECVQSDRMRIS